MPNLQALQQARRLIEEVDEDRLHMHAVSEVASCGTAYCLAGWMAVDPWFREHTKMGQVPLEISGLIPKNKHLEALGLARETLDLDHDDAAALFAWNVGSAGDDTDPHAVTKYEVLANLDLLLAGRPAEFYAAVG